MITVYFNSIPICQRSFSEFNRVKLEMMKRRQGTKKKFILK